MKGSSTETGYMRWILRGGLAAIFGVFLIASAIYASVLHGELSCIGIGGIGFGLLCVCWGIWRIKTGREALQELQDERLNYKPDLEKIDLEQVEGEEP
jgi:hypothetical protein